MLTDLESRGVGNVDADVLGLYKEAVAKFPQLCGVAAPAFSSHLVTQQNFTPEATAYPEDVLVAVGALSGETAALTRIESLLKAIERDMGRMSERAGGSPAEVIQAVRIQLLTGDCPKLARYRGQSPLEGWLRLVARRAFLDAARRQKEFATDPSVIEAIVGGDIRPTSAAMRQELSKVKAIMEEAINELSDRERTVFRMHLLDKRSIDAIGLVFGVHRATAARWLNAARDTVKREMLVRMKSRFRVDTLEAHSLVRDIQSRIDLTLSRVLS